METTFPYISDVFPAFSLQDTPPTSLVDDLIVVQEAEAADSCEKSLDKVCTTMFQVDGVMTIKQDLTFNIFVQDLDPALLFSKPTFSLWLTQEERPQQKETIAGGITTDPAEKDNSEKDDQLVVCRKSKRLKAIPKTLVGEYQCDMHLLNRARVPFLDPNNIGGNIDYSAKFSSLLDKLKSTL